MSPEEGAQHSTVDPGASHTPDAPPFSSGTWADNNDNLDDQQGTEKSTPGATSTAG